MIPANAMPSHLRALALAARGWLAPPRCIGCSRLAPRLDQLGLCHECRILLSLPPPPIGTIAGVDLATVATPYAGPAVALVAGLKSGRVPAAATSAAELICEAAAPGRGPPGVLVPVPSSPGRRLRRGLDPAEQIARALAERLEAPLCRRSLRRLDSRPQRGRSRSDRLADPPRFELAAAPHGDAIRPTGPENATPPKAILVDDVITTGATLRSCAMALRGAGVAEVSALCFALTPAPQVAP